MERKRSSSSKRNRINPSTIIIIFIIVAAVAFLGAFLLKKLTVKYGVITYSETLTQEEKSLLQNLLQEETVKNLKLKNNVSLSATDLDAAQATPRSANTLLLDIKVPVTDFYATISNVNTGSIPEGVSFISINSLSPDQKLLSLNDHYFFDDFSFGATYRVLVMETTNQSGNPVAPDPEDEKKLTNLITPALPVFPTANNTLSLAQTGVTALSRAMINKLNQVGNGAYFAENIKDFLSTKDLTHISNEVSFADNCEGGTNTTVLCSDWRMLDTITAIGTDIVELTGNHNNDYSTAANIATINKYQELGLKTFGGGKNAEEAAIPLEIDQKNAKITILGFNQSTSTKANGQGANGNNPGANIYDEATAAAQIENAKALGNFVIVDVQYFECYSYPDEGTEMPACDAPISGQADFFKHFIDLGADMVVGTQAHQPQTYELYKGKPIYYGLGNLFFDQVYWPGTTRSYILTSYFVDGKYVQTRLTPTVYDGTFQTTLMNEEEAQWFLTRLGQAR